jgi:uncharacterized protein (TIGR01777 family)
MNILITGATGFVGKKIVAALVAANHKVFVLTRHVPHAAITLGRACDYQEWSDVHSIPDLSVFGKIDGVINLIGENIAGKRWTKKQKDILYHSRVTATQNLVKALNGLSHKPEVFISTSAIGFYGDQGENEVRESTTFGAGFLPELCSAWEQAAREATFARVVIMRLGVVFGRDGGALTKILPLFQKGIGGKLGSGKQYMSWIHLADLTNMFLRVLTDNSVTGPVNCVSPYPITNRELTNFLAKEYDKKAFVAAPAAMLKLVIGEGASILLESTKVAPDVILKKKDFRYQFPTLKLAIKDIIGKRKIESL